MRQTQRPLTPAWVAGSVRARNMLARRIGPEEARRLAAAGSLGAGLSALAGSAYGRFVRPELDLAAAQRAAADTALWHIRVLAGWMPPRALELVRALASWFELANIEDRLVYLGGREVPRAFSLGGLASVWPRIAGAQSPEEIRRALSESWWGDPGGEDRVEVGLELRFAWARRVIDAVPEAAEWAAGAVALLLARERFLAGRGVAALSARNPPGVGTEWERASDLRALQSMLPQQAAWALGAVTSPDELWRAEIGWWRRVEGEAWGLARNPHLGRPTVVGCITLLAADARRVAAALASASRGLSEAFDAGA